MLPSFADALEALKKGKSITREKYGYLYYLKDQSLLRTSEMFDILLCPCGEMQPCFSKEDVLADDWLILEKGEVK
jgi:hypothetical protein